MACRQSGISCKISNTIQVFADAHDSPKCEVYLPKGANKNKIEGALLQYARATNLELHPWSGKQSVYNISPELEYETVMDLALVATAVGISGHNIFAGEVNLDGSLVPLPRPIEIGAIAKRAGLPVVVPASSAKIAALSGATVYAINHIAELSRPHRAVFGTLPKQSEQYNEVDDFCYVKGQGSAKRAMEIAVAGGHNILYVGPPGEGKSELARRSYTIAPPLSLEHIIECSNIWQRAGRLGNNILIEHRPFVSASLDTTPTALLGGGDEKVGAVPGLVSLAHNGTLLCDELFEWSSRRIESLRIPLQDRSVVVSRRDFQAIFPANFQLVATANPCPCGYYGHPTIPCRCNNTRLERYQSRFSGPIADRIDIKIMVPPLGDAIFSNKLEEKSETIRKRVTNAQRLQEARLSKYGLSRNAEISIGIIDKVLPPCPYSITKYLPFLSSRGVYMVRRIARTIADLRGSEDISEDDYDEAIQLMEWRSKLYR